jgi:enediyne core biosynthesis thioesterase
MNLMAPTPVGLTLAGSRPSYSYRHVVSFEETNVVGNVYFTRHLAWQGRCRELFLKEKVPAVLEELVGDLRLVTLRVSCEYFEELFALDAIDVLMSLSYLRQHRIGLDFDIVKSDAGKSLCVARGFQEIGCMRKTSHGLSPTAPPSSLLDALKRFTSG